MFTSGYFLCDWSMLLMTGDTGSLTTDTLRLGLALPGAEVGMPRSPTRRDLRCRVKRIPAASGEVRRSQSCQRDFAKFHSDRRMPLSIMLYAKWALKYGKSH